MDDPLRRIFSACSGLPIILANPKLRGFCGPNLSRKIRVDRKPCIPGDSSLGIYDFTGVCGSWIKRFSRSSRFSRCSRFYTYTQLKKPCTPGTNSAEKNRVGRGLPVKQYYNIRLNDHN